jgi:hypothetical protein
MQHEVSNRVAAAAASNQIALMFVLGARVMSNRILADPAPQALSAVLNPPRSPAARIADFLRTGFARFSAWRRRRREREALYAYLASDHRAASDIGYPHRLR